jgi:tetratricopeptide (TPR) repeat protein
MTSLVDATRRDPNAGLVEVERLITLHPLDARLHFLRGSLLAGSGRFADALLPVEEAVTLAPGYAIARYQLGFLQFTSGDTVSAAVTWAPLQSLGLNAPLALFAQGLLLLTQDRIEEAIGIFEDGIRRNLELGPVNGDIAMIVSGLRDLQAAAGAGTTSHDAKSETSAVQMLLQRYNERSTKH